MQGMASQREQGISRECVDHCNVDIHAPHLACLCDRTRCYELARCGLRRRRCASGCCRFAAAQAGAASASILLLLLVAASATCCCCFSLVSPINCCHAAARAHAWPAPAGDGHDFSQNPSTAQLQQRRTTVDVLCNDVCIAQLGCSSFALFSRPSLARGPPPHEFREITRACSRPGRQRGKGRERTVECKYTLSLPS